MKRFGSVALIYLFTGLALAAGDRLSHLPTLTFWQMFSIIAPSVACGVLLQIVDPVGGKQ